MRPAVTEFTAWLYASVLIVALVDGVLAFVALLRWLDWT